MRSSQKMKKWKNGKMEMGSQRSEKLNAGLASPLRRLVNGELAQADLHRRLHSWSTTCPSPSPSQHSSRTFSPSCSPSSSWWSASASARPSRATTRNTRMRVAVRSCAGWLVSIFPIITICYEFNIPQWTTMASTTATTRTTTTATTTSPTTPLRIYLRMPPRLPSRNTTSPRHTDQGRRESSRSHK